MHTISCLIHKLILKPGLRSWKSHTCSGAGNHQIQTLSHLPAWKFSSWHVVQVTGIHCMEKNWSLNCTQGCTCLHVQFRIKRGVRVHIMPQLELFMQHTQSSTKCKGKPPSAKLSMSLHLADLPLDPLSNTVVIFRSNNAQMCTSCVKTWILTWAYKQVSLSWRKDHSFQLLQTISTQLPRHLTTETS